MKPASALTPTPTPKPPEFNAVAKIITNAQDLIEGPMSRGRLGDYLLANSEIQVVIQKPERSLMVVGTFGGQILDADLIRQPSDPERDAFEEWALGINLENTAHYTAVTVINDGSNGQPAIVRATGVDDLLDVINPSSQVAEFGFPAPAAFDDTDLPIEFTTDYILAPNDHFVRVETTVRNIDPVNPVETFISEFLSGSGLTEPFLPGYGFGEPLLTSACDLCNFVAWSGKGEAAGVSYGYIHDIPESTTFNTNGVTIPLLGESVAFALTGFAAPNYTIAPNGGEVTVVRYFAVGEDVGSIVDIRNEIVGLSTGVIQGTVTRGGLPVAGADVTVLGDPLDGPGTDKNVVSHYLTDASGQYAGTLPPGSYTIQAHMDGHLAATPDPAAVAVTTGNTTIQNFTIPVSGRVRVTVTDETSSAIAAKVSLVGFDPYVDPGNFQNFFNIVDNNTAIFGDIFADPPPYGIAQVVFADQTGDTGEFLIEPGDYQVVVSHGTEYSIFEQPITVTAGSLVTVSAQIARVIDSTGFISGDFHVHALASPDGEVTNEERVVSMLAEGVDFFISTDHQFQTDYAPVIASLGVGGLISAAVSAENTTPDYGHFIGWPGTIDPAQTNGGALDWAQAAPPGQDFPSFGNYMMSPADIFANLAADPGVNTVHINHMDTFFGPDGLSIDTGLVPPQHFADGAAKRLDPTIANLFDDGFTALEVWQGTSRNNILNRFIDRNLGDWFNLINQGIVRTGYAVSDTHRAVATQSGFPRTYVASPTDDPGALGAIAGTLSTNVNDGRAVGSNGPFIRVTSSAASTGQTGGLALGLPTSISTTDGSATVTVDIQSPLWAQFDTVEYYINNVPAPDDYDSDPTTPPFYRVTPDIVQTAGADFTINTIDDFPSIPGAKHLEATTSITLNGMAKDTWVVVLVRGTDNVSEPIFPIVPNNLDSAPNPTLADLIDGNLGELGIPATAFSNPLFITRVKQADPGDTDGDGCSDQQENGLDEKLGGLRDWLNPYDYYDINGDGFIDLTNDIFDVIQHYAPTGSEPEYDVNFDRGPSAGPNVWNMTAPDGVIDLTNDILGVILQYFHSCQ